MKKLLVMALFIFAFSVSESEAVLDVSLYREFRSSSDPETKQALQLYVEATYLAIQTVSIQNEFHGYPKVFCPPPDKLFTIDDVYGLLDRELEKPAMLMPGNDIQEIAYVMFLALQSSYPCEGHKDNWSLER